MTTEETNPSSASSWRCLLILSAVTALLFLPGLGARDFWAPGEPIYGEIVRVMFEKGNWLVPMLNGQIYADKPVLYFWLALIFSHIAGGVSEWTVRLPAALGAFGLVLTTYQFGKAFFDRQVGLNAALILATSSRIWWEARFLHLDTLLAFFLFLGLYFLLKAFEHDRKAFYVGFYVCVALATLTKGPVGVVLPGLTVLAVLALSGRWRKLREIHLLWGGAIIAGLIVPWLLLLQFQGDGQWLRDFIWIHNVQNYALEPLGHVRPLYYYLINMPADLLPWTVLIPGALIYYYPWRRWRNDFPSTLLLCWFFIGLVFFSASKSKIAYYLVPILPCAALFAANYLEALMTGTQARGFHWRVTIGSLYGTLGTLLVAAFAAPAVAFKFDRPLLIPAAVIAIIAVVGTVIMALQLAGAKLELFFRSLIGLLTLLTLLTVAGVLPYLNKYKSPRPISEYVKSQIPAAAPVYVFHSTMADFNYYSGREVIPVVPSQSAIAGIGVVHPDAYILVDDKDLPGMRLSTEPPKPVTQHRVGDRTWYLLKIPPAQS